MTSPLVHWRRLGALALAIYVVAWFVPVITMPPLFPVWRSAHPMTSFGWDAVLTAFSPLLHPGRPDSFIDALSQVVSVASGLTNLVFLGVAWSLLRRRGHPVGRRAEAIVWECALLNLAWVAMGTDLRYGYVLWMASFVILAIAVHQSRREASLRIDVPLSSTA